MMPNRHNSRKSSRTQRLLKPFMKGVFRSLWWFNGQQRRESSPVAGFVFPTTLLLVLMVLLTASALTFRTFSRSTQVISQREQQVIYNAATPAIDRAKAKLEFLFQRDDRLVGVPSSDYLANMMLPRDTTPSARIPGTVGETMRLLSGLPDPYKLPDEKRLDINGDGRLDNAWSFPADVNGNGTIENGEIAAYSILVDHEAVFPETGGGTTYTLSDVANAGKASSLVTRTGPLGTTQAIAACGNSAVVEEGWQSADTGTAAELQKNFQITAFVSNGRNDAGQAIESLEFQQSRIANTLNKWGAWFRYDLGIFPGADFKWNGAMHTDGSLIVSDQIISYMLTSHNSCLYSDSSSEITLGEVDYDDDGDNVPDVTFQGQAIKGSMKDNDYEGGNVEFHLFNGDNTKPTLGTDLTNANDSVDGGAPADVAINPITLFLRDRSEHIDQDTWNRPPAWETSPFRTTSRIRNAPEDRPFVDDFFRADNRWGPKPRYDISDSDLSLDKGTAATADDNNVGDLIAPGSGAGDPVTEVFNRLVGLDGSLDGYWERQAISSGLRLIVGERLQLGNANGWGYDPRVDAVSNNSEAEPLYPAQAPVNSGAANNLKTDNNIPGTHEYQQHRTLRDNLAAVQGMVVYHYQIGNGQFPAACMAVTAHPGTRDTIVNSRTFNNYPGGALATDFLVGNGTNGWEFSYPSAGGESFATEANFESRYNNASSGLKKALTNLAYFAGDPNGGAPSFPPVQDPDFVHPFPYLSMWGDFSALRRIAVEGDAGANYGALSPADQATLHSAACTLSMLAYNLNTVEDAYTTGADFADLTDLATTLLMRVGANPANQIDPNDPAINTTPSDEWIRLAEDNGAPADQVARMRLAAERWQIERDRIFGFATGQGLPAAPPTIAGYSQPTGVFTLAAPAGLYPAGIYSVSCDPNEFLAKGVDAADVDQALTLALALCPKSANTTGNAEKAVKYPSLYYLFPKADHAQKDISLTTAATSTQYELEAYIDATAAPVTAGTNDAITPTYGENASVTYQTLDPSVIAGTPRAADFSDWVLPTDAGTVLTDANVDTPAEAFAINVGTAARNVAMLDKGIFNGREQMAVRVLDIDIDKITQNSVGAGDYWLPSRPDDPNDPNDFATEGILYAAREDAVREDEIVRPADTTATNCDGLTGTNNFRIVTEASCRMAVVPGNTAQDPPLQANNVSIKPVDFAPDPDRRAHGFRFRTSSENPADFSGGNPASGRQNGMTFVSDNTAYIEGDFNLHSNDGQRTGFLEEFTFTLQDKDFTPDNFYDDRTVANTNTANFADLGVDHWRPVEILTDALTVLSDTFPDGAVEDAFREGNHTDSSFASLNRPRDNGPWLRETLLNNGNIDATTPVWVDRNGTFYMQDGGGPGWDEYYDELTNAVGATNANDFITMGEANDHYNNLPDAPAGGNYVNATFVSGIVPERPNESYGGLHNYPRFLEDWFVDPQPLFISGSFIQLNFSTSATAPYDQEAWEPGFTPTGNEWVFYYLAPNRRWGFDVGLLYNPPAPAARRFSQLGRSRSEYYRELPVDDPYVENLICATDEDGNKPFGANICP
ncbi:MAG: hypothetical protein F6K00_04405 [Leptolyngbya sp. SIOISBB]|nr:hypothetical protein [Leptolyngbya sp. SIOISBB]